MEREFAMLSGMGWIGKNTLLLNRKYGSYFFLAALIEGFISPTSAPLWLKRGIAVVSTGMLMFYFVILGYPRD